MSKEDYPILYKFSFEYFWEVDTAMGEGRVMDWLMSHDARTVTFTEACDSWYAVSLNKQEMLQLSKEIKRIAEGMIE